MGFVGLFLFLYLSGGSGCFGVCLEFWHLWGLPRALRVLFCKDPFGISGFGAAEFGGLVGQWFRVSD